MDQTLSREMTILIIDEQALAQNYLRYTLEKLGYSQVHFTDKAQTALAMCKERQFDLIICYHILEHVIDDVNAMKELHRVLKPNGTVLIQTPFKEGDIYENYNISSEAERLLHFGQEDHVRIYSIDGLKNRLENSGFTISVTQFEKDTYLGFSDKETILFATK